MFTEEQIRKAFVEWCADYKSNRDAYQDGDSTDGEACANYLIDIIKKKSN